MNSQITEKQMESFLQIQPFCYLNYIESTLLFEQGYFLQMQKNSLVWSQDYDKYFQSAIIIVSGKIAIQDFQTNILLIEQYQIIYPSYFSQWHGIVDSAFCNLMIIDLICLNELLKESYQKEVITQQLLKQSFCSDQQEKVNNLRQKRQKKRESQIEKVCSQLNINIKYEQYKSQIYTNKLSLDKLEDFQAIKKGYRGVKKLVEKVSYENQLYDLVLNQQIQRFKRSNIPIKKRGLDGFADLREPTKKSRSQLNSFHINSSNRRSTQDLIKQLNLISDSQQDNSEFDKFPQINESKISKKMNAECQTDRLHQMIEKTVKQINVSELSESRVANNLYDRIRKQHGKDLPKFKVSTNFSSSKIKSFSVDKLNKNWYEESWIRLEQNGKKSNKEQEKIKKKLYLFQNVMELKLNG